MNRTAHTNGIHDNYIIIPVPWYGTRYCCLVAWFILYEYPCRYQPGTGTGTRHSYQVPWNYGTMELPYHGTAVIPRYGTSTVDGTATVYVQYRYSEYGT